MHNSAQTINCDLLVIGSGASGLATAVTAAHLGMKVIVLEKESVFGGTSAWSGGWLWVPRNPLAVEAGIVEDISGPTEYLKNELGAGFDEEKVRAFLENAPAMIDFFRRKTSLQFIDGNKVPDFHGKTSGSVLGGRSVCAAPFDGKRLGKELKRLRQPLDVISLWGMGIASGNDIKQFFNSTRSISSFLYVTRRVLRHFKDLITHGQGTQLVNGNALVAGLAKSAFDKNVSIITSASVKQLNKDDVSITGATVEINGTTQIIHATKGVVLACGGFPHDDLRKSVMFPHAPTGKEHVSAAPKTNTGDGIRLGESVGALFTKTLPSPAGWAPVSLVPKKNGEFAHFPHLIERGKPGIIAVNEQGKRFANEANSYNDFMGDLLKTSPHGVTPYAWLICDHRFIRRWGLGAVKPAPMLLCGHLQSGYLFKGKTIAQLATAIGIKPDALEETISTYNKFAQNGDDPEFGRGDTPYNRVAGDADHTPNPCVAPIKDGPYYAVKIHPGSLGTFAGLETNAKAQVLDHNKQVIPGLFAVGNDMTSVMAGHYPSGGITLGPGMTFAYIAAHSANNRN